MHLESESPTQGISVDAQRQSLPWTQRVIGNLRQLFASPAVEYICDSSQPKEDVALPEAFAAEVKRRHAAL